MNPSTSTRRPHAARNLIASKGGRDDIPNLNPSIIKRVRSLSEGCFILNNIKPSTFQALKYHYPELPEWNIRYDYDGLRESMTIKYIDSRIHDSVYVFFVRCIKEEIYQLERECCKQLQIKEFTSKCYTPTDIAPSVSWGERGNGEQFPNGFHSCAGPEPAPTRPVTLF